MHRAIINKQYLTKTGCTRHDKTNMIERSPKSGSSLKSKQTCNSFKRGLISLQCRVDRERQTAVGAASVVNLSASIHQRLLSPHWLLFMCRVISRKSHALDGGTSQRFNDSKVYQPFNELYCGFMIVWLSGNVYVWRIFVRFSRKKDKCLREVISVFHLFQMHSVLFLSQLDLINQRRIKRCK